jgi:hypothetical protein
MATYDPPQPTWKRNLAGVLDFVLAFGVCVYVSAKTLGNSSDPPTFGGPVLSFGLSGADYKVGGISALVAVGMMVTYFVALGRSGGTVFQRLFGMKRA